VSEPFGLLWWLEVAKCWRKSAILLVILPAVTRLHSLKTKRLRVGADLVYDMLAMEVMETVPRVPDLLKKNLDWYIANQEELSEKYNGKILLIVDQKLVQVFDSMEEAYRTAREKYELGTFTLQPCSPGADSYTLVLYSPAYSLGR
jgi:hypothetical protein